MESTTKSSSHAVYNIKLHIVFVTKYRRPCLHEELRDYLEGAFSEILAAWRCELIEFEGTKPLKKTPLDPLLANA